MSALLRHQQSMIAQHKEGLNTLLTKYRFMYVPVLILAFTWGYKAGQPKKQALKTGMQRMVISYLLPIFFKQMYSRFVHKPAEPLLTLAKAGETLL